MDEDEFWSLIAESAGDPDALKRLLDGRDREQLEAFDRVYYAQLTRAYTWDLWGAGLPPERRDERRRLRLLLRLADRPRARDVREGRQRPGRPADVADPGDDIENEELRYAVYKAYEATHGEEFPMSEVDFPDEPTGEAWDEEDLDALEARLPRIAAKTA